MLKFENRVPTTGGDLHIPVLPAATRVLRRRPLRYCQKCAAPLVQAHFDAGRKMAQTPESLAKRSATQRAHKQAIQNWKASDLPDWLTRDVYLKQVQPVLATVATSRIRSALEVSEPYSSDIRAGRRIPHPRHWKVLAKLAGVWPPQE